MTTAPVLAIVGAGSLNWGRHIAIDLLTNPAFAQAELRLIDIDAERVSLVHRWVVLVARHLGLTQRITATTDLRTGLTGCTGCITGIAVGGDRLWRYDALYPQLDGIFQPVGDSIGIGGAIRALRHAPALRRIAVTLSEVGGHEPVLLQVANPLNVLTAAVSDLPRLRVVGYCHGHDDTAQIIAQALGVDRSTTRVACDVAGNNHNIAVTSLEIGERSYDQAGIASLAPRIFDCPWREVAYGRYGVLIGNYARHPVEYLPGFITAEHGYGRAWGIPPIAEQIDPLLPPRQDRAREDLLARLTAAEADPAVIATWGYEIAHSREPLDHILAAFHTGHRWRGTLNVFNQGAIAGVDADAHVELPCIIEGGRVVRQSVHLPERFTAEVARVGREQAMLARCCRAYDEDLLVEALALDALMPSDRTVIRRIAREMVAFQRDLIGAS